MTRDSLPGRVSTLAAVFLFFSGALKVREKIGRRFYPLSRGFREIQNDGAGPRSRARIWLAIVAAVIVVLAVALMIAASRISPMARERVLTFLREKYQSEVELRDLKIKLFPRVRVTGEGLVMHYHQRTDLPPFVRIKSFSADAGIGDLLRDTKHVSELRLEGLEIQIPPKSERQPGWKSGNTGDGKKPIDIVVDSVVADGAALVIL